MEEAEDAGYQGRIGQVCEIGGECEYGGYDGFVLGGREGKRRGHALYSITLMIHGSIDM